MCKCCFIRRSDFKQCCLEAKITNNDGMNLCTKHKDFTIEEFEKKKEILRINNKLLSENPGKIPLRNNKGEIIDFAIVDKSDYDEINKYKWSRYTKNNKLFYSQGCIDNKFLTMHQFIMGIPPSDNIIDHIDHNGLNNKRENLRFTTISGNNQNREKKSGTSSKYKGVNWRKDKNKWCCEADGKYLGYFTYEEDAAKKYDTFVMLKYGKDAETNNLVKYEDIMDIDIETLLPKIKIKILPKNIFKNGNKYDATIVYDNKIYTSKSNTIDEAIIKLSEFTNKINEIKANKIKLHYQQPILRNQNGDAVLCIKNGKGEVPVPENRWHELSQYTWNKNGDYFVSTVNGKLTLLHRFLMNAKPGEIVDHVNNDKNITNNNYENLRLNTATGNSHNRKKKANTSSQYIGVSLIKNTKRWRVNIKKDNKNYFCGNYDSEKDAALAYDKKAIELYGKFANLNFIPAEKPKLKIIFKNKMALNRLASRSDPVIIVNFYLHIVSKFRFYNMSKIL